MRARQLQSQEGLALLGSLLLISMLAVLSTAFLLMMAADVRIAQSHHRNTQAYYYAESAASAASYMFSMDDSIQAWALQLPQDTTPPLDTTLTMLIWDNGVDSLTVLLAYPLGYPAYKRLMWAQGFSGKASFDIYRDVLIPSQDPRTYYAIVAGSELELEDNTGVEGGEGVWMSGSDPDVDDDTFFDSPTAGSPRLLVGGTITWAGGTGVDPYWSGILDIQVNAPLFTDVVPQVLLSDSPPYQYKVTGDATVYEAEVLHKNYPGGGSFGPTGFFGVPGDNPMGIWVWDYSSDGTFEKGITLDGTLYCPDSSSQLTFEDGDVTITPLVLTLPGPDERYPAIVSKGRIRIRYAGTRRFNGLVYVRDRFYSSPASPDTCYVDGVLIADKVHLMVRTFVRYADTILTQPSAPFTAGVYPTIALHQRRHIMSWLGF